MILRRLVLSNLAVHRVRAALTIAAIALSVSLVVAVTSGYSSAIAAATKFLGYYMGTSDLQVTRSKGDPHGTFTENVAQMMRQDSRVKQVVTRYGTEALLLDDTGRKLAGRPIDLIGLRRPQDTSVQALQMEHGGWFESATGNSAVVDQMLAERYKLSVGSHITLAGPDKPLRLEVVGVAHKPTILAAEVQTAYVPLETLQRFEGRQGQINRIMITLKRAADADAFKSQWLPKIEAADPLLAMKSAGDMRRQMDQNLTGVHFLSYLGGATAMLAATFIIFSALSMGVTERQRTLAMLRAIGAYKGQLARLVVLEGVMLAAAGVLVGVPLGWLWVKLLATWKADFFTAGVVVNWSGVAFGAVVSVASALLASLLPAYTASRVDPLEAMAPLARPPESRVPLAATIAGLACVSIDSLLIFLPTSREVKFYGHFALGLPAQMLGYFLLAPLFVWTFERAGGWLLARLLGLQPALLRQQLSGGIWRAAGTGAALMVGLAILVVMQVQGHSTLQGWRLPNKFPDIFIWSPSGTSLAAERKLEQTPGIRPGQLLPIAVTNAVIEGERIELKGATLVPSVAMFFGIDPNKALDMIELEFRDDNGNTAPPEEQKRLNKLACDELKLGRHLVITDEYRRLLGKKRGDTLTIRTPLHGDVKYTISGVVWSPGIDVIVSMFDMDRQFDQRTATSLFGSLEDASRDFGVDEATFFAANLDMGMDKAKLVEAMQKQAAEALAATATTATTTTTSQPATTAPAGNGPGFLGGAKKLLGMGGAGAVTLPATQATGKTAALFNLKQLLGMSGMQAGDVRQIKWQIQNGFEKVLLLLSTVAFASMAVAALGVTNTIMASIRSRRWQFGVLRSVGVTRAQLLRLVLAEAMLLGLVGCALGLVAGFQMSWNAHGLARFIVGFVVPMSPPWGLISTGAGIVVVTAVLASIWPAASVARAEPLALLQAGRASA